MHRILIVGLWTGAKFILDGVYTKEEAEREVAKMAAANRTHSFTRREIVTVEEAESILAEIEAEKLAVA